MKNRRLKVIYIIIFIAAVFFAAFVLVEFRKDYLAVALAAIVMLIAAYFLVDKIERDIYERYDLDRKGIDEKINEATGEMRKGYDKIDQLSEAILQASLKGLTDPKQKLSEFVDELSAAEQAIMNEQQKMNHQTEEFINKNEIESMLTFQQETISLIKTGFKTLIQYSKENARQVALNTNQNTEQLLIELNSLIQQLKKDIPKEVEESMKATQNQFETLSDAYLENITLVSQRLDKIEDLTQQLNSKIKE